MYEDLREQFNSLFMQSIIQCKNFLMSVKLQLQGRMMIMRQGILLSLSLSLSLRLSANGTYSCYSRGIIKMHSQFVAVQNRKWNDWNVQAYLWNSERCLLLATLLQKMIWKCHKKEPSHSEGKKNQQDNELVAHTVLCCTRLHCKHASSWQNS